MFGFPKSQKAYTIHERPDPPADRDDRAEELKFVREGFSFFAFLLPPIWMLVNRLWMVLFLYALVAGAAHGLITLLEVPEHWRYYLTLGLNLLIGFEADVLRRWTLDRRGWRMVGAVSGANFDECERRFFEGWVPAVAVVTPSNFDAPGQFEAAGQRSAAPHSGIVIPPKRSKWRSESGWRPWKKS